MARVAILGDHAQRLPFTRSADLDARSRLADGHGREQRLRKLVVLATERAGVATEGLVRQLERLFESFEALLERREWNTERVMLLLEPRRADAEEGAPPGQYVQCRDLLEQEARIAVRDPRDLNAQPDLGRHPGDKAERGIGLEHRLLIAVIGREREVVVHDGDLAESSLLRRARDGSQVVGQGIRTARPGKNWYV